MGFSVAQGLCPQTLSSLLLWDETFSLLTSRTLVCQQRASFLMTNCALYWTRRSWVGLAWTYSSLTAVAISLTMAAAWMPTLGHHVHLRCEFAICQDWTPTLHSARRCPMLIESPILLLSKCFGI